jgi:outer membrane receptor for ferrienterochelin and colicins
VSLERTILFGAAIGFSSLSAIAQTEASQTVANTISLPVATDPVEMPPATPLDAIVVTGTRTEHRIGDSPVDVQLIRSEDIAHSGARDLAELLEREGGVYVSRVAARGTSIEIQGLSSEHVLILVDGRRMIGQINGAIDLTRLRVADIERVEIIKGPNSALYGADALGGVVNVITRKGPGESGKGTSGAITLRGDLDANGELYGYDSWALGGLSGSSSAGYAHSEAFDLDDATLAEDGADADAGYASTEAIWQLSDAFSLGLSGAYALDDSHRLDPGSGTSTENTHKRIEEVRVGLAPQLRIGGATTLSLNGYYNRYFDQLLQRNLVSGDVGLDEETLAELYVGGGQLDHRIGRHLISVGAETQFERLDADRLDIVGERDRQSVYLQDQLDLLGGRLQVVPGLRYDRDSQFDEEVSPKLALRYDLGEAWVLRAGFGKGYRAPDFKQLLLRFENSGVGYRVDGNPDLRPEYSSGYNLGATWFTSAWSSVALSAYHNRVRDLIEIVQIEDGPPILFTYRNVARARLTGIDLQTQFRPWQPLEVRLGYGWLDTEDVDTGKPLSGRAEHRGNVALRYEQPAYALSLRGVWIGKRVFDVDLDTGGVPTSAGEADAYALYDLRAEWTRWARWVLATGVENAFDAGDSQYLPIQPRTVYFELQWRFE